MNYSYVRNLICISIKSAQAYDGRIEFLFRILFGLRLEPDMLISIDYAACQVQFLVPNEGIGVYKIYRIL